MSTPILFLRRLVLLGALAVLLSGVWTGIYASSRGLTRSWREAIRSEFARQGITLSMGRLTLDPIHGLVARDVRLYEDKEQKRVLLDINQIDLDVSIPRLFRKQISLNSLYIRDAMASIPLDPKNPDGERLDVSEFNARVLIDDDQIEVQEMRGRVLGVMCHFVGELVRDSDEREGKRKKPRKKSPMFTRLTPAQSDFVTRIFGILRRARMPEGGGVLKVHVVADTEHLEEGRFDFSFTVPVLCWEDYQVEDVTLRGRYENGLMVAEDIRFRDEGGNFRGEADFVRSTRMVNFNVESHALLIDKIRQAWWPEVWPKLELEDAPRITVGGKLELSAAGEEGPLFRGLVIGTLALGRGVVGGVPMDYASGAFSTDGETALVRGLRARSGAGTLEATMLYKDGQMDIAGESTIAPDRIEPFIIDPGTLVFFENMKAPPGAVHRAKFTLTGKPPDPTTLVLDVWAETEGLVLYGIPVSEADSRITVSHGKVVFADCRMLVPKGAPFIGWEGETTAESLATAKRVVLHPRRGEKLRSEFEGVRCVGWPRTVLSTVVPELADAIPLIRFDAPVTMSLQGESVQDLGGGTDLKMKLSTPGTAYWTLLGRDLPLVGAKANLRLKGYDFEIESVRATLFGGNAAGGFYFAGLNDQPPSCRGRVGLQAGSYQELMALFSEKKDDAKGQVDIDLAFETSNCTGATFNGRGSMSLVDGDLFSIPLFGPLSPLVEAVLPNTGIGYSVASRAGCTYEITKGVAVTEDFTALTPAFRMDGGGAIGLLTGDVDFWARLNARGLAKAVTVVFSYIFEYKCEGTVQDPVWRPAHLPKIPRPRLPLPIPLIGRDPEAP